MACDSSLMAFAAFLMADLKASKTIGFISLRGDGNVDGRWKAFHLWFRL